MKNLSLITDYVGTGHDNLLKKSLKRFYVGLAEELIILDDIEPIEENIFLFEKKHTARCTQSLELSTNSSLEIKVKSTCEWEYLDFDEFGIGSKGDISGVKSYEVEIEKITLYLFDGSEFDLTNELNDLIFKYL